MAIDVIRDRIRESRALFSVHEEWVYLDVASRAPMSTLVATELRSHLDECQRHGARKWEWLERAERVRARAASFLNAEPDEIAFSKNTSDGLNVLASGITFEPGDNIVLCPALEHPNNVYAWMHRAHHGVELRTVSPAGAAYDTEALTRAIDDHTKLVAISSVSFLTGSRPDLASLALHCDAKGAFLLVDAVQSVGTMRTDVKQPGVGGLATATQKGLLGMYGLGITYCGNEWAGRLRPQSLSRAGVDNGYRHESEVGDISNYKLARGARRLEMGNHNFAGLFALDAALDVILRVGVDAIESHVHALGQAAIEGIDDLGWDVATPRVAHERGNIVAFRDPDAVALADALGRRRVRVAARRGLIRASFHVFNDMSDVERLLQELPAARAEVRSTSGT
jgi:cysteine desulfurase / selenocysteine lyase